MSSGVPPTRLTIMRHGEANRDPSQDDPGLSERGIRQATAMADVVALDPDVVIYASPLNRARQTARIVAERLGRPVETVQGLAEFDAGAPYRHFEDGGDVWQSYFAGDFSPWGTTLGEFNARVLATVEDLAGRHRGGHVLAVGHGGVINSLTTQILGVPERVRALEPDYCSLHRFVREADRWRIHSLNEWPFRPFKQPPAPAIPRGTA